MDTTTEKDDKGTMKRLPMAGLPEYIHLNSDLEGLEDPYRLVDFLELILNNVYSGIIVCDRHGRVIFMNQVYSELLNIDRHQAVGLDIKAFFPSSRLGRVMETGQAELGQRCSLKTETPLLVNRIPLKHKGETTGAILQTVFRDYQDFTDLLARLKFLEREVTFYKKGLDSVLSARYNLNSILGRSKPITELKRLTAKYAHSDAPVLVVGPTGTGKELFAHAVHNASPRYAGPFVCVNCAAIPRDLLESELFGYESGAFTGASRKGKPGQIELAHQGTLYLDEIGELPQAAQAKLLRVLETKMLSKVGGVKRVQVDFRLVAATNRELSDMIDRRLFRDDLYYRLNAMTITVPPLSQRSEDIPVLVRHFLENLDKSHLQLTSDASTALAQYGWPGNVRELKNVIERAVSLTEGDVIGLEQLPRELVDCPPNTVKTSGQSDSFLADELAVYEKALIKSRLDRHRGNMAKTARSLGISRSTLYEKCRRLELV